MKIAVLGAGAWGTMLAGLARNGGADVTLMARNADVRASLAHTGRHPVSLSGYRVSPDIEIVGNTEEALALGPDAVVIAVPSSSLKAVAEDLKHAGCSVPILTATKGIEPESLLTASQRITDEMGGAIDIAALSGPNLATEIAAGLPAAAVVASLDDRVAREFQLALTTDSFRVYTSSDIVGVELAGALKNVFAIGAGIADGLNAGQNAKAAYLTRGVAEMVRLGVACGANPMTFAGLAGIGDLFATANSSTSRNNTVGRKLAEGKSLDTILDELHEVAEGVPTTKAALRLGKQHAIELPITTQIARIMFDGVPPASAIATLMARDVTEEA